MYESRSDLAHHLQQMYHPDESNQYHICVGARPGVATRYDVEIDDIDKVASMIQDKVICGSNMRGSKEYRSHLVKVLTARALRKVESQDAGTN